MIIGNGDIASILNDREDVIFFVSGVSNSSETRESEYDRERVLLLKQDTTKCIFYFSTISIDDETKRDESRYISHKMEMEYIIKAQWDNYNIIRIGNIDWGNNPHTFINYIRNKIKNNQAVLIRDEYKFIINVEQLLLLTDNLPVVGKNQISAFGNMKKVKDII